MSQWTGGFQSTVPLTPMVKRLIILNLGLWIFGVLILQNFFLDSPLIFQWLGLVPRSVLVDFWIWQPFTYNFIHAENVFHVLFNMLILWWFGAELEIQWGSRYFLFYYMFCGVGAGLLYVMGIVFYSLLSGNATPLLAPVVGASGAIFGLMIAYAWYFGDRMVYFMMMFPMKVRLFVTILGGIEILNLLSSGISSQTANLAHLGGLLAGFLFLKISNHWPPRWNFRGPKKWRRNLKLIVNNNNPNHHKDGPPSPKYWN